ncbi:hypothetical protein MKZ38_001312 [Zalerion maritima]|uniref:Transcriptional coactivator p15 (PC4) C-terminal domain-containing protein n=1 Tax=Zalerion maritima TaxID=339359 RepID=A0AAD5RY16_9PEZI|nr:hypothetical protein MKZ38_001312 [Zalerion maritima]
MAGFKKRSRDDAEEPVRTKTFGKKQKNATTAAAASQDDTPMWELGNKRRLTISKFGGRVLVNIREYYEKDGEMLPGKKGISLTTEQWETIVSVIEPVNGTLRAEGVVLKGDDILPDAEEDEDEAMDTDSDSRPMKAKSKASKAARAKVKSKIKSAETPTTAATAASKSSKKKANIEATSDEDDGEDNESEESDDES